jgi:7,8-dihydro-6-hydroxymethylpterin-pyrophosphokinase
MQANARRLSNEGCYRVTRNASEALIFISVDFIAGATRLRELVAELETIGSIKFVSSVFKKYLNSRSEDLNSILAVVVRLQTTMEFPQVFEVLKFRHEENSRKGADLSEHLVLLAYDSEVFLHPDQNLPSSQLHGDALTLRCASEAWGDYKHPVLGQTLNELVSSSLSQAKIEFFAQGHTLV